MSAIPVASLKPGMTVDGELGPSVVLGVEVYEYRHSREPGRSVLFRDLADGIEYRRLYTLNHTFEAVSHG